jgi:hypothetical protein
MLYSVLQIVLARNKLGFVRRHNGLGDKRSKSSRIADFARETPPLSSSRLQREGGLLMSPKECSPQRSLNGVALLAFM